MADLTEPRVREIVRDELSVMQVPEKLSTIMERLESLTENKADKADIEELKGEIKALDERMSGEIKALDERMSGKINALDAKQDSLRDLIKSNFRIGVGIAVAILAVLVKLAFFP
ncbi:MAG: hypothetical protein IEMM0008_0951 [bacterium]|nr:MAG: hypothetical protein IEMM0008_0951 [bacterium]